MERTKQIVDVINLEANQHHELGNIKALTIEFTNPNTSKKESVQGELPRTNWDTENKSDAQDIIDWSNDGEISFDISNIYEEYSITSNVSLENVTLIMTVYDEMFDFIGEEEQEKNDEVYFDLTPYNFNMDVYTLLRRYQQQTILIPSFQRDYVWNKESASMFIDSLLRGLPCPSLFFYEEDRQKYLVIDGQQRLLTLYYFITGKFPTQKRHQNVTVDTQEKKVLIDEYTSGSDDDDIIVQIQKEGEKIEGISFKLTGKVSKHWYGKTFKDLSKEKQRILLETYIYIVNLKQTTPAEDNTSMFLIFERINTGAKPLNAQQVRLCVGHGRFAQLLVSLANNEQWEHFGLKDKDGAISELILRFFALYNTPDMFKNSMRVFLDQFILKHKQLKYLDKKQLEELFNTSLKNVCDTFTIEDFSPKNKFNGYVLLVVWLAIAKNGKGTNEKYKLAWDELRKNEEFQEFQSDTRRAAIANKLYPILKLAEDTFKKHLG